MTQEEKRSHRCCFTGHRPEKMNAPTDLVCEQLQLEIENAIRQGFTTFISGMSRGVDLWAAQIVLDKRKTDPNLKLICAVPFPGFESRWNDEWKTIYHQVLESADLVRYISPQYSSRCFQIRNCWMVDHSALLIAGYNGSSGGTRNTIDYALKTQKCKVQFLSLDPAGQ